MLRASKDRKVANSVTKGGAVRIANAFGLPSGESCPGMTETCNGCYAARLENVYKGIRGIVDDNYAQLLACGDDVDAMADLIRPMIIEFVKRSEKFNAPLKFRIHWDGDFYSLAYAEAWATIVREFPAVTFWVYTRSFGWNETINVLPAIVGIDNLTVYLSVDEHNALAAAIAARDFPGVRIASLAATMLKAKGMVPDTVGAMCPEITKQINLISEDGGACITCGICVDGTNDVRFSFAKGDKARA
jgi:hypothetical protein